MGIIKEYKLTNKEFNEIIDVCGIMPHNQKNINQIWKELGEKYGFVFLTVIPSKKGRKWFYAEIT